MTVVVAVLAVLVGVSLGLLGGGGSILTVPLLVYVAGLDARAAIATSLLVVGVTSAVGAVSHARAGRVRWRTGLVFGVAGMAGAYVGGRVGTHVDGTWLLLGFAGMMVATSVAMLRGRRTPEAAHEGDVAVGKAVLEGVVVGLVTGLVGAGGGFLVVPALALLGGLPMGAAVGTSLVVVAVKSMAGLAGYLSGITIDWGLATVVTLAAVVGSVLGGRLVGSIGHDRLRRVFGWFVAVMAAVVLVQEAPPAWRDAVVSWPGTWVAIAAVVAAVVLRWCRRALAGPGRSSDGTSPAAGRWGRPRGAASGDAGAGPA